jgi:hypothetical protein
MAATHLDGCSKRSGSATLSTEKLKHSKYCRIKESYTFVAFSLETFGLLFPSPLAIFSKESVLLFKEEMRLVFWEPWPKALDLESFFIWFL